MTPDQVERAACHGMDPRIFFPAGSAGCGHPTIAELTAEAKKVCAGCDVLDECRGTFADEPHGVFFGTDEENRGFSRHRVTAHRTKKPAHVIATEILAASPGRKFTCVELAEIAGRTHDSVRKALYHLVRSGDVWAHAQPLNRPWLYQWAAL